MGNSCNYYFVSVSRDIHLLLHEDLPQAASSSNSSLDNAQEQADHATQVDITRYRKVVWSAVWVQLALGLCYLPCILLSPFAYRELERRKSPEFYLAVESTVALIYFNSSLNPILYCWKNKEIRQGVRNTLRKLFFSYLKTNIME